MKLPPIGPYGWKAMPDGTEVLVADLDDWYRPYTRVWEAASWWRRLLT